MKFNIDENILVDDEISRSRNISQYSIIKHYISRLEQIKSYLYRIEKRFLDYTIAIIAIILLIPMFLVICVLIKIESGGGPIFYKHTRIGLNGKEFQLLKFRSMIVTDKPLEEIFTKEQMEQYRREYKVDNDPRITKIGSFLRKTSLDELPQLFNILLNQMSLVGPRPVLQEETERYGDQRSQLLSVKPHGNQFSQKQ